MKVRMDTESRTEGVSGSVAHRCHWKTRRTAADRAHSGGRFRQPWGVLGARVWGNRERGERGLNRRRRGVIWGKESEAIKRKSIGRGELVTGVIWGRRADVTVMWGLGPPVCERKIKTGERSGLQAGLVQG